LQLYIFVKIINILERTVHTLNYNIKLQKNTPSRFLIIPCSTNLKKFSSLIRKFGKDWGNEENQWVLVALRSPVFLGLSQHKLAAARHPTLRNFTVPSGSSHFLYSMKRLAPENKYVALRLGSNPGNN
jgi:hypothetical protein